MNRNNGVMRSRGGTFSKKLCAVGKRNIESFHFSLPTIKKAARSLNSLHNMEGSKKLIGEGVAVNNNNALSINVSKFRKRNGADRKPIIVPLPFEKREKIIRLLEHQNTQNIITHNRNEHHETEKAPVRYSGNYEPLSKRKKSEAVGLGNPLVL